MAEEMGCVFTERRFTESFGRTSREILADYWPVKLSPEQIAAADDRKEHLYRLIVRDDFPEMPGARRLVRALHEAGFALAVGSSGPRANVEVVIEGLGAGDVFDATVCGEDVTRGKPDPEVFLTVADRLGVRPGRCVVVEDATAGVAAANRAGMLAIALTGTAPRDQLAAAEIVVDSLAELTPQRIAECLRR